MSTFTEWRTSNAAALLTICALLTSGCSRTPPEPTPPVAENVGSQATRLSSETIAHARKPPAVYVPPPSYVSSANDESKPTEAGPIVSFTPGDMETAVGDTPIRVFIDNGGHPIDSELVTRVSEEIELVRYADATVVPTTAVIVNPTLEPEATKRFGIFGPVDDGTARAYIELRPVIGLSDDWYLLAIKRLPTGLRTVLPKGIVPRRGVAAARFRTGSGPTLKRVVFCGKEAGSLKTMFEFTENVKGNELNSLVGVEADGASCRYTASGPEPESSMLWVEQECSNVDTSRELRVFLNSGIQSQNGVPVRAMDGQQSFAWMIRLAELPSEGSGCKSLRL